MKNTKLLLTALAITGLLAGCGKENSEVEKNNGHFGFGGVANYEVKAATDTKVGSVQTDITFASILLGKDGKIQQLRLDAVQVKVAADEDGAALVRTNGADPKSKWELLEDYNMVGRSPIEKEWYEQAEAFENFAVGKTVAELAALELDTEYLKDGEAAGVTIKVAEFMDAIERANADKVALDDISNLKIGVGGVGTEGNLQSNYTIAAAAFKADKTVAAARMDVYQIPYALEAKSETVKGAVSILVNGKKQVVETSAGVGRIKAKHELGFDYNMKDSATKGEWFEQANKITAYMVGKTIETGLAINAENNHMVNEVAADVTIKAVDYRNAFDEAVDTAFNSRTDKK